MARLKMIEESEASLELKGIYNEIKSGLGMTYVANWFKVQGANPTLLRGNWEKMKATLLSGKIPLTTKQLIQYAVSAKRGCDYCTVFHRAALVQLGVSDNVIQNIVENIDSANVTDAVRQGVSVAMKAALTPMELTDHDVESLYEIGYDASEVQELLAQSDLINMLNTIADSTGITIDSDLFVAARMTAEDLK